MRRTRTRRAAGAFATGLALPALATGFLLLGSAARADADADAKEEQVYRELTTQASEIELGMIYNNVDGHPFDFGNYNGLVGGDNLYVLGDVDIFRRSPWDGDSSQYYRLRGLNLGLDSRHIDAEYGHQGRFGLSFLYDELPVYDTDTAKTFFLGLGSSNLTLPPGWMAGPRADLPGAFQSSITANNRPFGVEWKRKRYGGAFSLVLPAHLELEARYDYETKKGNKLVAALMGQNGGNPRSLFLPEPLDLVTQQVDAALRYAHENLQLGLAYYGSFLRNEDGFVNWMNPYTAQGGWDQTAGFMGLSDAGMQDPRCAPMAVPGMCGLGRKGQPPDNMFHQIVASGGYDLPHRTRVTLNAAFGWMLQDDDFLPYTINPNLMVTMPLPRSSLDGEIFTKVVDFGINSRPLPKLRLDLAYKYDDRENNTPQNTYFYIRGDSENQSTALDGGTVRTNLPLSLTRHQVDFDAGYQLPMRSELVLGYGWEQTERDFQEVEKLWTHALGAILTSRPTSFLNTRLHYEHSWRNGSSYDGAAPFLAGNTPQLIQDELADPACAGLTFQQCVWENHPLLRKYYLADLHRDELKGSLTYLPREDLTIAGNLSWRNDDYHNSDLGLVRYEHASAGVDVSFAPSERLSTYAFYNYEWGLSRQNGWSFSGGGNRIPQSMDPTRRWSSKEEDATHTVGVGFDLDVIAERLGFGADYLFADSQGRINVDRGPALTGFLPFPDTRARQHNVSVHTEYHFSEHCSVRLAYLFERLRTKDWAYDGLAPTSIGCSGNSCVIGTGQESLKYTANVVAWSFVYKFW